MGVAGIVAEYNPFHNGHLYHLRQTKKETGCDHCIAVISGNFVQRGEPALFDKFTRAAMAVQSGVDLVLEIPPANAVSSAEYFSKGAIAVLTATGIVDTLSFGSETGDLSSLQRVADILTQPDVKQKIQQLMKTGIPVWQAMEQVAKGYPSTPNDILGVEYLKALRDSNIKPYAIRRMGTGYHDQQTSGTLPSATAIRQLLSKGESADILMPFPPPPVPMASEKELEASMIYALRVKTPEQLKAYADVSEGLENKIYDACRRFDTLEEIIQEVKSKRYSYTRIRRILYHIFLDIPSGMREKAPEFIRVLAFNERGQSLLAQMRKTAKLPVINCYSQKDFINYATARLDKKENDLYALALPGKKVFEGGLKAVMVT